jgi:preprotein translocase subunit YajC
MFISEAYAQAAGSGLGGLDNLQQFLPLILIFVVFYFLLLRPQQKKAKAHREMVAQLRRGDRVLTQGGIIGQVNKVLNDTEVLIEIAEGVRVRMMRSTITEVMAKTEPVGAKAAKEAPEAKEGSEAPVQAEVAEAKPEQKSVSMLDRLLGRK